VGGPIQGRLAEIRSFKSRADLAGVCTNHYHYSAMGDLGTRPFFSQQVPGEHQGADHDLDPENFLCCPNPAEESYPLSDLAKSFYLSSDLVERLFLWRSPYLLCLLTTNHPAEYHERPENPSDLLRDRGAGRNLCSRPFRPAYMYS
jgi:hypothetical protein